LFASRRPVAIYALHTSPLAVGVLGTRPGRLMAAREANGVTTVAGVVNDTALVTRANSEIRAALGDSAVREVGMAPPQFSEDFGSFQEQVPGVMWFLGVGPAGMPHSPGYVADEASILVGARAMVAVLVERLARE
jgi:metal-dependent amidase/aminoacylase/carboxypeptidase family protein